MLKHTKLSKLSVGQKFALLGLLALVLFFPIIIASQATQSFLIFSRAATPDALLTEAQRQAFFAEIQSNANSASVIDPACKRAGCSGEFCVNVDEPDVFSTCLYEEEYACYDDARCEVQADGNCGWTEDLVLLQCLN